MIISKRNPPSYYRHQFAWIVGKDKIRGYPTACREAFLNQIPARIKKLSYTCSLIEARCIKRFIDNAEKKLKIKCSTFEFQKQEIEISTGLLIITLSPFWLQDNSKVRMHLFTILIRSGQTYKGRAFFEHAKKSRYLNVYGFYAFKRFFEGNIYYASKDFLGWVYSFCQNNESFEDYKKRVNLLLLSKISDKKYYLELNDIQSKMKLTNNNINQYKNSKDIYEGYLKSCKKQLTDGEQQLEVLRKRMDKLLSTVRT